MKHQNRILGTDAIYTTGGFCVVSVPKGTAVTIELTGANADQEYHGAAHEPTDTNSLSH